MENKIEVRILWASRHKLDDVAKSALIGLAMEWANEREACPTIEAMELLWPAGDYDCRELAKSLFSKYDIIAGVFPAQALPFLAHTPEYWPGWVVSPVSVPVIETDTGKVRKFEFLRWVIIN